MNRKYQKESNTDYLKCPKCECEETQVIETRPKQFGKYRRRTCVDCGFRFSTAEIPMEEFQKLNDEISELKKQITV